MSTRLILWLAICLPAMLVSAMACAADNSAAPHRISLDKAFQIALRDNRDLRAAGLASEATRDKTGVALGQMLPRLDAAENFSYSDNPVQVFSNLLSQQDFSQDDFALSQLNHPGFLSNFQSQVRLSFPLFTGGRLLAGYRAAGFAADAARWQMIESRQRVEFAVIESYYAAAVAEQRLAVIGRALAAARAHLKQARDLFQHGMVVNSDVLRTEVLAGTLEQQQIAAESGVKIARAQFAHVLGNEDEPLAPLVNHHEVKTSAAPLQPLDSLVRQAQARRPEIKIAVSRVEQEQQAVLIARADYFPTIEITGGYENDSNRLTRAGNNGGVMVSGRLNLFNGMATMRKVDAAQASLARAQVLQRQLRRSVALEVETAYRRLVAADKALQVAKRDTAYADRALKILEDRYSSGLATNASVLDAHTAREDADLRLISAQTGVVVDRAALRLVTGADPRGQSEP